MKRIFIALICLAVAYHAAAQPQDPAAEPYLQAISEKLDPSHAVRIDFEYTREDLQSGSTVSGEGVLHLFREMYRIGFDEAMIWFDGKKQYSLNTEVEEVYVRTPDPEDKEFMFSDPIKLLRTYRDEFKYVLLGQGEIRGMNSVIVQLDPLELGGPYAVLKLYFDPAGKSLQAVSVRHKEGILYTMVVTELAKEEEREVSFFRFNEKDYPMVDVIELVE